MNKPLYEVTVPMRYGDMDTNGHINNVAHFRFFEEGRVQWLASLNVKADGSGVGPVVAETSANFKKELHYPGVLVVRAFVKRIGNSSYTLQQQLVLAHSPDQVVTEGTCTIVWFNHNTKQSTPLPEKLIAILSDHVVAIDN